MKYKYTDLIKLAAAESTSAWQVNVATTEAANAAAAASKAAEQASKAKTDILSSLGNVGVGAGLGAIGGGLVSLLPTKTPKHKRLGRALMLMAQGGILGGATAGLIDNATGFKVSSISDRVSSWLDERRKQRQVEDEIKRFDKRHNTDTGDIIS